MADPFSIVAGAVGVVDVAVRLVRYIDKTKKGADSVDGDLQNLLAEIQSLKGTSEVIHHVFEKDMEEGNTTQDSPTAGTWSAASKALEDCNAALTGMHRALVRMIGDDGSSRIDRVKRHRRRLAQDEEFGHLRQMLDSGHHRLQTLLLTLKMSVCSFHRIRCSANNNSLMARQSSISLSAQMAGQEQLIRSLGRSASQNTRTPDTANVHFMIPKSVSNLFVGRKLEMLRLKQDLEEKRPAQSTMKVVVYGLNGSGKTELCCKFAQDNRSRWVSRQPDPVSR